MPKWTIYTKRFGTKRRSRSLFDACIESKEKGFNNLRCNELALLPMRGQRPCLTKKCYLKHSGTGGWYVAGQVANLNRSGRKPGSKNRFRK